MFGYLSAETRLLTQNELDRYKACYCGLCRCLRERHGGLARLTLNYDMCFLVLLLQSLYEPKESSGEDTCLPHPIRPRAWQSSACTAYGADMNIAMAYYKCLDDWEDDGSLLALGGSKALQRAFDEVCERYPRQCAVMQESLRELSNLETEHREDPDAASACFGRLLGELFVWREDRWADTLRRMGEELGKAVYVMDACMDLDSDAARGHYNPFRRCYGLADNADRFRAMLQMLMGDCLRAFDVLPLVQDVSLLKNILCMGFWTQFDRKYGEKKE
jgi:hypothetical protein